MSTYVRLLFVSLALVTAGGCGDGPNNGKPDGGLTLDDGGTDDGGGPTGPKITMCPTAGMPALASGTCQVTAGGAARLITAQSVLTPGEVFRGGQVLIDDAGKIACVGCDCAGQATGATQIQCPTGVVSPGLINSHDHITFQAGPGVDSGERYEQRHDWRKGIRGHAKLSSGSTASAAQIRLAEMRFVIGGATSTVSSGGQSGFLRNLDKADPLQEGLAQKAVDFDTFPLGDTGGTQLSSGCAYPTITSSAVVANDDAYFPHVSEGIDAVARNEFFCASSSMNGGQDLAQNQSAFIHAVGLTAPDYSLMASKSVSLVWSPRSNVRLYGDTAQVAEAARLGVLISLGTDWLPSGSMNLLRELQCADSLNANYYNHYFNDEQLWMMVTANAATATATDDVIGTLKPGLVADISIFDGATRADHRAVIGAAPEDVVLVLRGGKPLYGDQPVVDALADGCEALDICTHAKSACVMAETGQSLSAFMSSLPANNYPLVFCGKAPDNEPSCTPSRPMAVNSSTTYTGMASTDDKDGDGVPDATDNCPAVFNPVRPVDNGMQPDFDADGVGDMCDPCPMAANSTMCQMFDPNDADGDMIANALDNCPMTPNTDQLDTDGDMKGDACDACPNAANPGVAGCPASIYAIKTGMVAVNAVVSLPNVLVTGKGASGFFVQVKPNDPGYTTPSNSGLFVYAPMNTVLQGDRVDIVSGTVTNYFGQIELSKVTVMPKSTGEALPPAVTTTPGGATLTAADLATGATATAYEGVLVQVANVRVTDINPAAGTGDTAPTNEFVVEGTLRVNDLLHLLAPFPAMGDVYTSLTGILELRNGSSKLEPRTDGDATLGPPQIASVGPNGFVRVGTTGGSAIPAPLLVTLTRPATAPTVITLATNDLTGSLTVPATVTVPMGMTTAEVLLTATTATAAAVDVTGTLNSQTVTGKVRVIDANAPPTMLTLSPPAATVSIGGSTQLTLGIDLPAPADLLVDLVSAPGGTVPAQATILKDQLTATFTYKQTGAVGTDTVTATAGALTAMATVKAVGHLVINEIDYDQVGTDANEFIELYNPTTAAVDLTNLAVVLVNGSGLKEYLRINLTGTLEPDSYLVIASKTVMVDINATTVLFAAATDNVQNGAPDAVLVLNKATGEIVDALSYEGSITAAIITGLTGTRSLVEGTVLPVAVADSNTAAGSLIRSPNGADIDNASLDWSFTSTPTPGTANVKTP